MKADRMITLLDQPYKIKGLPRNGKVEVKLTLNREEYEYLFELLLLIKARGEKIQSRIMHKYVKKESKEL